jgi:hypothetical protein
MQRLLTDGVENGGRTFLDEAIEPRPGFRGWCIA